MSPIRWGGEGQALVKISHLDHNFELTPLFRKRNSQKKLSYFNSLNFDVCIKAVFDIRQCVERPCVRIRIQPYNADPLGSESETLWNIFLHDCVWNAEIVM
jgi:hypothetical protein